MGNRTASRGAGQPSCGCEAGRQRASEKPVALTLKVDRRTAPSVEHVVATQRRTNQDILEQALKEYLNRSGAY